MGCACISKRAQLESKDIDLNTNAINYHNIETKENEKIYNLNLKSPKKLYKPHLFNQIFPKEKSNTKVAKIINQNKNKDELVLSGPIISLLRREAEKINHKKY